MDVLFINKSTSFNYTIDENSFNFNSKNNKNNYNGFIDFKPFYFSAKFDYEGISSKNFFNDNSIFIDVINSEILNNKNLSANLNLNVKNITNINELNNLNLRISIEEGNISFSDSKIMWKQDLEINFDESLITLSDEGINLVGSIYLNFKNIDNFYSSFQIPKSNRKKIKKIKIDFIYNFNSKNLRFDNPKIDNIENTDLEDFLNNFNLKEDRVFNKIKFKNFVNNFIRIYSG